MNDMPDVIYARKDRVWFYEDPDNVAIKYVKSSLNEWQDIISAPKDDTQIVSVEYDDIMNRFRYEIHTYWSRPQDGYNPTHWKPLDLPPSEKE